MGVGQGGEEDCLVANHAQKPNTKKKNKGVLAEAQKTLLFWLVWRGGVARSVSQTCLVREKYCCLRSSEGQEATFITY